MSPDLNATAAGSARYVFFFARDGAEGNGKMKDELGGKGAALAEMTSIGLPVPPGFTIQTAACREYLRSGRPPEGLEAEMRCALKRLEQAQGQTFGSSDNPLLVSVRSGAKFSMPGMMDTILDLGLNRDTVEGLSEKTRNPRFAYDSYRRFIQMFGSVVLGIQKEAFEAAFNSEKKRHECTLDTELNADHLKDIVRRYEDIVLGHTGRGFPHDPFEQLIMARDAVFRSWGNERAKVYRRIHGIPDDLGTGVNVQAMVFGNMGETSGTGVGFTRNPATGEKEFYGEVLMNAQGEDVVAGIRTPMHIRELERRLPECYRELRAITWRLEQHYRDMQDFEFTVQEGRLYMLQTRSGKRNGRAAVRIALDMVDEGLVGKHEAIFRVNPNQLYDFLLPRLDEANSDIELLAKGLPASPGAAVGQIAFTAAAAVQKAASRKNAAVILVRADTTPEDIHGMEVAAGVLTSRGGMTSHAAVVARGMGKCCIVGASEIEVSESQKEMRVGQFKLKEDDWISLDGESGRVLNGKLPTLPPLPKDPGLQRLLSWSDPLRKMRVRGNADTPRDALQARALGAEGIGLCRTEHMFFAEERISQVRAMILARTEAARELALDHLLPMQRHDFEEIFRAMSGLPVTIRLLDPPLHEFLPKREELMVEVAQLEVTEPKSSRLDEGRQLLRRLDELHESNPMLGHRGCRLGITYPEITRMQSRAIFEAAVNVARQGVRVSPEVMVPLISTAQEMEQQKAIIREVAREVSTEMGLTIQYLVGAMIELPRACMVADEIADEADFFSFGTNDLTQTVYGFSRDDIHKFLPLYISQGLLKTDPFASLDRSGVGGLMRLAIEKGRKANNRLKIGICGEHGGDPASVEFCQHLELDYVSCSPYRVPTARLAAAQSAAQTDQRSGPVPSGD